MTTDYTGKCHCERVQFRCTAAPEFTFYCHCSDCQRLGGSPFAVELMVSDKAFELSGETKTYTVTGDSGQAVHRHFCPCCGTGVHLECDSDPGYVFIKAGTLDDASWVKPDMHIFAAAQQPWLEITDDLPRHDKMPPE